MNALQYKLGAPCGDPARNGLGMWRAGQVKPIGPGQERYAAGLVATGAFDYTTLAVAEAQDDLTVHTDDEVAPLDAESAWDNDPDATMADDDIITIDDED